LKLQDFSELGIETGDLLGFAFYFKGYLKAKFQAIDRDKRTILVSPPAGEKQLELFPDARTGFYMIRLGEVRAVWKIPSHKLRDGKRGKKGERR
jgi:hypothetical protein